MIAGGTLLGSTLMLTGVNLLLRFAGTGFQVWLSGRIGAEGVGLLQLVLSVNFLALTLGTAGGRTAAMYLTAAQLGQGRRDNADRLLGGCFMYSTICSAAVAMGLFFLAPRLAEVWIGSSDAVLALRTWAAFLPVICLCGIMTGYFTAAQRIGTLAAVEVAEQLAAFAITVFALSRVAPADRSGACRAVVLGSCLGAVLTLICLMALYAQTPATDSGRIPVAGPILKCALPLALADDLRAGISALENLLVPRRLSLYQGISNPLAAFGKISGMVFPVLMFPAAILASLSEVLIPELARCAAVGSRRRIRYLVRRNLRMTMIYGLICSGILYLVSDSLGNRLYPGQEIGPLMRRFSLLVPMLYCDLISDAMTRGLGQQTACARYSIVSNVVDVSLMFFLLPRYGIDGYFFSFTLTHALNFALGLRRTLKISGVKLRPMFPAMSIAIAAFSLLGGSCFTGPIRRICGFLGLFLGLCFYTGTLGKGDVRWMHNLIFPAKKKPVFSDATNS